MDTVLKVINLKKYYRKTKAVDDISFNLERGEIIGLIGANGAGKTTTIKCILSLLKRTSGEVYIDGLDIKNYGARQKLAYIPETPEIYPLLTVWEHLKFIALAYRLENWEEDGEGLLEKFNLKNKKNELGKNLSKGMKQKLSICCTLLHRPEIFLVDEPFIGLDPKAIKELKDNFLYLKSLGKTILISTHMLDIVQGMCDRILIMKSGKLIAEGSLEDLKFRLNEDKGATLEEVFLEVTGND